MAVVTDAYLDQGMRGFIVSMAAKNAWRVAGCDIEDLIQEGYFCYYKCRRRYVGKKPGLRPDGTPRRRLPARHPDKVARKHFQRIVQRAFRNHIYTMALKQPALREVAISQLGTVEQSTEQVWDQIAIPTDSDATVMTLLRNAPWEVRALMQLLVQDALDGYRRLSGGGRETTNQRFCRLLGIPAERNYDITGSVEQYFLSK